MKRAMLGAVVVAVAAMMFATSALAATRDDGNWGYLEICKYADSTGPVTGTYNFTVSEDGTQVATQSVAVGTCSAPFSVPSGTATVQEDVPTWSTVTAISAIPATNLISSNPQSTGALDPGPNGTATVTVVPGDVSTTTTVNFTNKEVTGYIEVCKKAALDSGLTGSFQFTINGPMGFTQNVTVPVGACSDSIQVPAGQITVTEDSASTYVTDIDVQPSSNAVSTDLNDGTATVNVVAGDVSSETIVTVTDAASVLKICKVAGDPSLDGQSFPFTANGTSVSVPAGPPPGGTCEIVPGIYTAGTTVNIAEGVVPGTEVSDIDVNPSSREVPGSLSLASGTVAVVLGSGETVVTYTDIPAPPGTLKICKIAGSGVAAGSLWTFTIAGTPGSVTVPAGSCVIAGPFPYNSTQTVTESPTPGFAATAIAAAPSDRLVGTPDLATATGSFLINTGVTEALFTNSATTATGSTGTGSTGSGGTGSTGSGSTGTTTGSTTSAVTTAGSRSAITASVRFARLVKRDGHYYVVLRVASSARRARVRLTELSRTHRALARLTRVVATGKTETLRLPSSSSAVRSIKVAIVS